MNWDMPSRGASIYVGCPVRYKLRKVVPYRGFCGTQNHYLSHKSSLSNNFDNLVGYPAGLLGAVKYEVVVPQDYPNQFGHFPGADFCNVLVLLMRRVPVGTTRTLNTLLLLLIYDFIRGFAFAGMNYEHRSSIFRSLRCHIYSDLTI